jgi:hypothetical protein
MWAATRTPSSQRLAVPLIVTLQSSFNRTIPSGTAVGEGDLVAIGVLEMDARRDDGPGAALGEIDAQELL